MKNKIKTLCFKAIFIATSLLFLSSTSLAKNWRNSYVSFDIPDSWKCILENTEWICRSSADKESKEAVIVLTAKEVGPTDTFDAYSNHLSTPQKTSYVSKNPAAKAAPAIAVLSKVVYPPKKVLINDQPWMDGLHMASEVPNYYTRYLATIKDRIAILFTCSAYKDYYSKYSQDFFKAVQSLRVIAAKDLLSQANNGIRSNGELLGPQIGEAMPGDLIGDGGDQGNGNSNGAGGNKSLFIAIAIVLAALGGYILMKKKNK